MKLDIDIGPFEPFAQGDFAALPGSIKTAKERLDAFLRGKDYLLTETVQNVDKAATGLTDEDIANRRKEEITYGQLKVSLSSLEARADDRVYEMASAYIKRAYQLLKECKLSAWTWPTDINRKRVSAQPAEGIAHLLRGELIYIDWDKRSSIVNAAYFLDAFRGFGTLTNKEIAIFTSFHRAISWELKIKKQLPPGLDIEKIQKMCVFYEKCTRHLYEYYTPYTKWITLSIMDELLQLTRRFFPTDIQFYNRIEVPYDIIANYIRLGLLALEQYNFVTLIPYDDSIKELEQDGLCKVSIELMVDKRGGQSAASSSSGPSNGPFFGVHTYVKEPVAKKPKNDMGIQPILLESGPSRDSKPASVLYNVEKVIFDTYTAYMEKEKKEAEQRTDILSWKWPLGAEYPPNETVKDLFSYQLLNTKNPTNAVGFIRLTKKRGLNAKSDLEILASLLKEPISTGALDQYEARLYAAFQAFFGYLYARIRIYYDPTLKWAVVSMLGSLLYYYQKDPNAKEEYKSLVRYVEVGEQALREIPAKHKIVRDEKFFALMKAAGYNENFAFIKLLTQETIIDFSSAKTSVSTVCHRCGKEKRPIS